jgi:hypothetical protein
MQVTGGSNGLMPSHGRIIEMEYSVRSRYLHLKSLEVELLKVTVMPREVRLRWQWHMDGCSRLFLPLTLGCHGFRGWEC